MRRTVSKMLDGLLRRRSIDFTEDSESRSALIFAPHQDDETLGCGGTIARKRRRGTHVNIVFMCDGSRSHRNVMPAEQLRVIRALEAVSACRELGVPPDAVTSLGYEEAAKDAGVSALAAAEITSRISDLLRMIRPAEVYIPYFLDQHVDHVATNRAVLRALEGHPERVSVFEYPIWYWNCWPFALGPRRQGAGGVVQRLAVPFRDLGRCGRRMIIDFNTRISIRDVEQVKRSALAQYRSQTTRLVDTPRWKTLYDTSNGDFVARFFGEYEWFRRYEAGGTLPARGETPAVAEQDASPQGVS